MDHVVVLDATHLGYWAEYETAVRRVTGPREQDHGIEPATCVITKPTQASDLGLPVFRVAFKASAEDVAELQAGGCVWLSTWGALPMFQLEVQPALADVLRTERTDGRVCPDAEEFVSVDKEDSLVWAEHAGDCSIPWAEHSPATRIITIVTRRTG